MTDYNIYGQYKNRTYGELYGDANSLAEARKKAMNILDREPHYTSMSIAKITSVSQMYGERLKWVGEVHRTHGVGPMYFIWIDEDTKKVYGIKKDGTLATSPKSNTRPKEYYQRKRKQ